MQGETKISFGNLPGEDYFITMPNVYARGIMFGTMLLELGDSAQVRCPKSDLVCTIEFKVKVKFLSTSPIANNASIICPPPLACLPSFTNSPYSLAYFILKGFFTGTYNAIHGKIKRESTGETLHEITGKWCDEIYIKKVKQLLN